MLKDERRNSYNIEEMLRDEQVPDLLTKMFYKHFSGSYIKKDEQLAEEGAVDLNDPTISPLKKLSSYLKEQKRKQVADQLDLKPFWQEPGYNEEKLTEEEKRRRATLKAMSQHLNTEEIDAILKLLGFHQNQKPKESQKNEAD